MFLFRKKTDGRGKLYFASFNPDLEKEILQPKVPKNFLTAGKHMDWQVKRTEMYGSVDDALSGLLQQNLEGKLVYIYEPAGCKPESLIRPGITAVPYTPVLREWWYCTTFRPRLVRVVQVGKQKAPDIFRYGPRQTQSKILRWNWTDKTPGVKGFIYGRYR